MKTTIFLFVPFTLLLCCKSQPPNENKPAQTHIQASMQPPQPARRPTGLPGYYPQTAYIQLEEQGGAFFPKSPYESDMSMLDFPADHPPHSLPYVHIISPQMASSWEEAGINDPKWQYFLITPGDYRSWGPLVLKRSGSPRARRILRYYNPKARQPYHPPHPVKMAGQEKKEVLLESFDFQGADYWILHGLTFRGKASHKRGLSGGLTSKMKPGSDHNIIDYCLFERFLGIAAIRILQANYNLIQRSVFRNKIEGIGVDMGGIVISARANGEARGNMIVSNEFYNLSDAIGLQYNLPRKGNPASNAQTGTVPATVIDNNDIYIQPRLYVQKSDGQWACAEDGIDIKVGTKSKRPEDQILVLNNRIWGFRPTDQNCGGSGSTGVGILLHRQASNILIKNNIIFNTAQGIVVFGNNPKKPDEKVENITIENNLIYDIRQAVQREHMGLALRLIAPCTLRYNTICKAEELLLLHAKQSQHLLSCNIFKDIKKPGNWKVPPGLTSEQNVWINYPQTKPNLSKGNCPDLIIEPQTKLSWQDYTFFIRRWTGPEAQTLTGVLPAPTAANQLALSKKTPCQCQ